MVSKKGKTIFAEIALIFIWLALVVALSLIFNYLGNNQSYIDSLNNNTFFSNFGDFALILLALFLCAFLLISALSRFVFHAKLREEIRANPPSKSFKNRMIGLFLIFVCIVIFFLLIKIRNGII